MNERSLRVEMLDDDRLPVEDLYRSLRFMTLVNACFGGIHSVVSFFEGPHTPDEFTVLDLGCGSGDIPFALARWASKKGKKVTITAIDLNPHCLAYAQKHHSSPSIHYLKHSAFDLEALGTFDYIISSMFFHHLPDDKILKLLKTIDRQSRRGFVISDLYRNRRNYIGASLLSFFSFNKVVKNDACLSVLKAFQEKDLLGYREKSDVPFEIKRKPIFRIVMSRHA